MELILFLIQAVGISLSGVMAPGPFTAVAIVSGARNRYAGALMAIGHGIVEFPLMIIIVLGAGRFLQSGPARLGIGLIGGVVLLLMGIQMLRSLRSGNTQEAMGTQRGPFVAGIILAGGKPYCLVWWATVGLALATKATALGLWAFVMFAVIHWLCDLLWLTLLSWASFKSSSWFGARVQQGVLLVCGRALLLFGSYFLFDVFVSLYKAVG